MIRPMSTYVTTAGRIKGRVWAAKHPEQATELWVVAQQKHRRKRVRIGPDTEVNRRLAERKVAEYQAILERKQALAEAAVIPTFREAADAWGRDGMPRRSAKTKAGRSYQGQRLADHFEGKRLDAITALDVRAWWVQCIEGAGLSHRTGHGYLNALSLIFKYAQQQHPDLPNPVDRARAIITAELSNTAESRSESQDDIRPVSHEDMGKLLPVLERGDQGVYLIVLLGYECGLRLGEACGLRWGDVWFGRDEDDTTRHIHVQRSRQNGLEGRTKSGRSRKVAISRRLRSVLLAQHMAAGRSDGLVVGREWGANIRANLRRACKRAGVAEIRPKDLRDTYASTLVTHGIVLKWISLQLGHASVAVTERHYAAYMATDGYRNPWMCPDGCLPVDLFAVRDQWFAKATNGSHPGKNVDGAAG